MTKRWEELLSLFISDSTLHAKWLNTLSYLENCGARKIARIESPTFVKVEMLKHAAEEFRHAYYLKRQIARVSSLPFPTYEDILGGRATLHYLHALDIQISRYLLSENASPLKEIAYPLVTYAIEKRAFELYPLYHRLLKEQNSPVTVASIFYEEKEHLEEMESLLEKIPGSKRWKEKALLLERDLCDHWLTAIERTLSAISHSPICLATQGIKRRMR